MKLYLIRHAQSANNVIYARTGSYEGEGRVSDPGITEIGLQQAQQLANLLADESADLRPTLSPSGFGFTHLYCSLMTRTIESAMPIAQACGLKLIALEDTFERGGMYEVNEDGIRVGIPGPTRDYFMTRFPGLILPESLGKRGWYDRAFETEEMFVERMKKVVPEFIKRHAGTEDSVALVTHGHFIDQFMNELMGVERHSHNYSGRWQVNWAFHNTSISRIDFVNDSHIVIYLNRIDHLSPDLMT